MSSLQLNTLRPVPGSNRKPHRVGRGSGSGFGKTAGRGQKGQKSRSGGGVRLGFEGGQMPLQRRLPKFGFSSRVGRVTAKVRLAELEKLEGTEVNLASLQQAGLIRKNMKFARIFLSGKVTRAFNVQGIKATKGATAAIEAAGGKVASLADAATGKKPARLRRKANG